MSNAAANDTTETTTIPRCTTYESSTWRAHRYSESFRITSLVNAGKRGKTCEVFSVYVAGATAEDRMEAIAPAILWAAREGVSVEAMRATLRDVELCGLAFEERSARGVDIARGTKIEVVDDLVDVTFTETEMHGRFTAIHATRPLEDRIARGLEMLEKGATSQEAAAHVVRSSFRQDTPVSARTRLDAAKAYKWAQRPENRKRLVSMTLTEFRSAMDAIGVRLS